jgi:hypothetical protein
LPRAVRDTVLFVAGLLLIVYEARRPGEPRLYLLVLYSAMVGLPDFLGADVMSDIANRFRRLNGNGRAKAKKRMPPAARFSLVGAV